MPTTKPRITGRKIMLVYQAGIANIFEVSTWSVDAPMSRAARRIYQGDFVTAAAIARGISWTGIRVKVAACNMAGDIINQPWTYDLDSAPWSEKFARFD